MSLTEYLLWLENSYKCQIAQDKPVSCLDFQECFFFFKLASKTIVDVYLNYYAFSIFI